MGGVLDGQSVNAAITDPAFLFKNADDTATVIYTLANPNAESGDQVDNIQASVNALGTWSGMPSNHPVTGLPPWAASYVGTSGDNLFDRAEALTERFSGTVGHLHDGTDGNGPQIVASGIAGILGIDHGGTSADTASGAFFNLAPNPSASGDVIQWDGSAWVSDPLDAVNITGTLPILHGGTGADTASGGFANLAPTPGPSGYVMTSNGSQWLSAPASGGGGGGTVVFRFERYVDATLGNDSTGDGSLSKPYQTISAAVASITDNDFDHQYVIRATGGEYIENVTLIPYVSIVGDGMSTTNIVGNISLTVPSLADNHLSFLQNFLCQNITINTSAVGASLRSTTVIESVNFQGTFAITGGGNEQEFFLKDVSSSFYFGGNGGGSSVLEFLGTMTAWVQNCRVGQAIFASGSTTTVRDSLFLVWVVSSATVDIDPSTLDLSGLPTGSGGVVKSISERVKLFSTTASVNASFNCAFVDATSGALSASLPTIGRTLNERITVKNIGSANTVTVSGSQQIEGASSLVLSPGESVTLVGDTANSQWRIVARVQTTASGLTAATFTASGSWVAPSYVITALVLGRGASGGGGGGSGGDGGSTTDGGAGGDAGGNGGSTSTQSRTVPVTPGNTYAVTVGAKGVGGASGPGGSASAGGSSGSSGTDGTDGGNSSFDILVSFQGGGGGKAHTSAGVGILGLTANFGGNGEPAGSPGDDGNKAFVRSPFGINSSPGAGGTAGPNPTDGGGGGATAQIVAGDADAQSATNGGDGGTAGNPGGDGIAVVAATAGTGGSGGGGGGGGGALAVTGTAGGNGAAGGDGTDGYITLIY